MRLERHLNGIFLMPKNSARMTLKLRPFWTVEHPKFIICWFWFFLKSFGENWRLWYQFDKIFHFHYHPKHKNRIYVYQAFKLCLPLLFKKIPKSIVFQRWIQYRSSKAMEGTTSFWILSDDGSRREIGLF